MTPCCAAEIGATPKRKGWRAFVKGDGDAQQAGPAAPQASSAAIGGTAGAPHPEASEQVQATALTELIVTMHRPGASAESASMRRTVVCVRKNVPRRLTSITASRSAP